LVGHAISGVYPINSYYYLHKLWLRQLIILSFQYSFELFYILDPLSSVVLRWLGAHVEKDVKLGNLKNVLYFPSNLLKLERGVTTFGAVKLSPFELTHSGHCRIDQIYLGSGTSLSNNCTLMPGTQLAHDSMVGTLTLITRETRNSDADAVLLGIPAHRMPFSMLAKTALVEDTPLLDSPLYHAIVRAFLFFFISKVLFISFYCMLPATMALLLHTIFYCAIHRYTTSNQHTTGSFSYFEFMTLTQRLTYTVKNDFNTFVPPFLLQTQFLVFLYRALGAQIGYDVILPDIHCLSDAQLATIGDHVRVKMGAIIQVTPKYYNVKSKKFKTLFTFVFSLERKKTRVIFWLVSVARAKIYTYHLFSI